MARRAPTTTKGRTDGPERDVVCVDLFCGAGGLTHGLIDAGVKVVAGVDSEEACRHPYEANHPGITFHGADVAKLDAETVRTWFGNATVRVLAGCAPSFDVTLFLARNEGPLFDRKSMFVVIPVVRTFSGGLVS